MNESNTDVYACDEVREVQRLHHDLFTDQFPQLPIRGNPAKLAVSGMVRRRYSDQPVNDAAETDFPLSPVPILDGGSGIDSHQMQ